MKQYVKVILMLGAVLLVLTSKHNLLSNRDLPTMRAKIDTIDARVAKLDEQLKNAGPVSAQSIMQQRAKLIQKRDRTEGRYRALILQQVPVRESLFKTCPELNPDLLYKQTSIVLDYDASRSGCFSPDGTLAATVSEHTVKIWQVDTGSLLHVLDYGNQFSFWHPEFSNDGKYLSFLDFTPASMGNTFVIDVQTGQELYHHRNDYYSCVPLVIGNKILTGLSDRIVIRNVATGDPLHILTPGNNLAIGGCAMSRDGRYILMEMNENNADIAAFVYNTHTAERLYELFFYGQEGFHQEIVFSPDGNYIMRNDGNKAVLLDAKTGRQKHILMHNRLCDFAACDTDIFSCDRKRVVTYDDWELEDSDTESETDSGTQEERGIGTRAIVWDVRTGHPMHTLVHDGIREAKFSPDGNYVLTQSKQKMKVWDAQTGTLHAEIIATDGGEFLLGASFSPDSSTVILGDNTLWNIQGDGPMPSLHKIYSYGPAVDICFDKQANNMLITGPKAMLFLNINKLLKTLLTIDQCDLLRALQMQFIRKEFLEKLPANRRAGRNLIEPVKVTKDQWRTFKSFPELLQKRLKDYITQPSSGVWIYAW